MHVCVGIHLSINIFHILYMYKTIIAFLFNAINNIDNNVIFLGVFKILQD